MPEPLVGRDVELRLIDVLLDRATSDGTSLVLVGEPGVGKTALLDAADNLAGSRGIEVARGSGVEFEQELSFSGLHQVLFPLLHRLPELDEPHCAALGAALGLSDAVAPDRQVISTAALELVRVAAAAKPLLLVVDDVQWLDSASSGVLGFVGRRLAGSRAGLLAACRPDEAETFRSAIGSAHEVLPLDPAAAAALLARRLPSLPEWTRGRTLDEAEGYPLALLELPTGREQRRREPDDGLAAALPLSARLQELFRARMADLPDPTRRLLLLAALDGTGELRVLEAATHGRGLADLAAAEHARLVHADPESGRLRFRHPLARAAIVELATLQERREVHRLIAGMVTDNPERQAHHLADAADGPDEAVAARLEDAGRQMARRGDGRGAVAVMVRAAALSQDTAGHSRRLAEAAFVGVNLTWDLAQAAELLADARRAAPGIVSPLPAVAATAFLYLNGDGDVDAALRLLVDAVGRLPGELDAADNNVVALLSQLYLACLYAGRTEPWHDFRAALDRLRPAVPDDLRLLNAAADPARAGEVELALLAAAIVTLDDETDPSAVGRIAGTAHNFDLLAGCRTALKHAIRRQLDAGATASAVSLLSAFWRDAFLSGDWDGVLTMSEDGMRLCEEVGSVVFSHSFRLARAFVAAGRGQAAVLDAEAGQVTSWAMTLRAMALHYVRLYSRALGAIGRGDYAEAYGHLVQITTPGQSARFRPIAMLSCMDLVEAAGRTATAGGGPDRPRRGRLGAGPGAPVAAPRAGRRRFRRVGRARPCRRLPAVRRGAGHAGRVRRSGGSDGRG